MSILSTNHRLIKVGQDYSAGSGISIDDHVISVTGNQEASVVVQSNSATWNEISAVSGNYWPLSSNFTAKNSKIDINGLVNHHLYLGGANPYIRGVVDGFPYYNWEIHSTHVSGNKWEYGANEYNKLNSSYNTLNSNSGTWNDVSTTVQTNSAQWSDNTGDEEVNEFVYNNSATINEVNTNYQTNSGKYLTTADSSNFYPSNNPSGFITGVDLSNYYTKNDTSSKQEIADAFASVPAGDVEVNSYVHSNSAALNESTNVVQSNSAAWGNEFDPSYMSGAIDNKLDESAFADVSGSFLTAHQSLAGYATENWVTAQGYITGVDLSEYAKTNDVLDDINSAVSGKLDTTSFSTVSGDFLTAHQDISNKLDTTAFSTVSGSFLTAVDLTPYYTTAEADTLSSMLSGAIDYVSANAGGGGSPSGFVSGANVLFVPNEYVPGQGKVYSANISGDITVSYGDYFNSGENINIFATYSLSSVGSQIGDKLNKSVIEDSKTLSIIDDKAEVYSFAYRPSGFVTTGITVDNFSGPDSVDIHTRTISPYKLYSASLVIESDGFNTNFIPDKWVFVNSANGSATFARFYKDKNYDNINFPGFWDYNLTNASAYSVACDGLVIDALAFKSDLTGQGGGGVPQSAFDELKLSYDALSASYASLSSLFATYSGQWLLPNEGV